MTSKKWMAGYCLSGLSNYAGGQKVGEIRIREYQVNPKLSDSLFVPGE
jgi:hypothetical protein